MLCWGLGRVLNGNGDDIPVSTEMFTEDGVVRFTNLTTLLGIILKMVPWGRVDSGLTMNLRSLLKVKRRTASMRWKGSS